jgi:ElaB/YqjD/DUF883 family membrane-anchored ribosome-binding protein
VVKTPDWPGSEATQAKENRIMNDHITDQAQAAATPDLARIVDDLASLKRDFANLVEHVKTSAVTGAGDATDALRSSVGLLGGKARGVYHDLAAQGEHSAKAIGRKVEERPITSLLVAFGIGMLASRLLPR